MKINEIIRTRRQMLGLTQEALADKLGVSAPAVNKWEKALNYPDIMLLPTLARILGTDMNTLLCFQEDMSREEISKFLIELSETAKTEGCAAAFQLARSKLREFPGNDVLACNTAVILEGLLDQYPEVSGEDRISWEQELAALYERAVQSADPQVRESAAYFLSARCMGKGKLERAEALLERLPDTNKGKISLLASLREKQGRREEAWNLLETELLSHASAVQMVLLQMTNLALTEGERDRAESLAETAETAGKALGLSDSAALSARFQLALSEKNGPRALTWVEKFLDSLTVPGSLSDSTLYRHRLAKDTAKETRAMFLQSVLDHLETDPEGRFLRDTPGYRGLVEKYRNMAL